MHNFLRIGPLEKIWAVFQYLIRRFTVRTREVSKPRDLYIELSDRSLLMCLSNFKLPIFTRTYDTTSNPILKRGPGEKRDLVRFQFKVCFWRLFIWWDVLAIHCDFISHTSFVCCIYCWIISKWFPLGRCPKVLCSQLQSDSWLQHALNNTRQCLQAYIATRAFCQYVIQKDRIITWPVLSGILTGQYMRK